MPCFPALFASGLLQHASNPNRPDLCSSMIDSSPCCQSLGMGFATLPNTQVLVS
jgi:hypothetical protein